MKRKNNISDGELQVEFVCPKCELSLAWALPSASVMCPKCKRWITDANRKHLLPADIYMPINSDQLVLFKDGD